jgi:hypothetical protein
MELSRLGPAREVVMLFGRKSPARFWDAAGYVCVNAAELGEVIGADRWDGMVTALVAAKPGSRQWRDAIAALNEAAIAAGVPAGIGLGATMGGGFPPPPPEPAAGWGCPVGRCRRVVVRRGDMDTPLCAMSGAPMRLVE